MIWLTVINIAFPHRRRGVINLKVESNYSLLQQSAFNHWKRRLLGGKKHKKKLMVGLIWKTSAPSAIYNAQTGGRDAHTHWEHESRPRSPIGADATFPPVDVCGRAPSSVFSLAQADVGRAPGAGLDKSGAAGALCGSTQIREELFTRDCGVLSFTTAHFPSFHHAAIKPNPSWNICCEAWAKK